MFYYVLFSANRTELTEQSAKKTRPACNACCYLDKQLNESENEEAPIENSGRSNKKASEVKLMDYTLSSFICELIAKSKQNSRTTDQNIPSANYNGEIFHPPEVLS
ncbi:MAG: hypothetical protein IPG99_06330 [Ignavibacteria bacterium]|nr:hypothetical protein [Ignavibacteria bacterium]